MIQYNVILCYAMSYHIISYHIISFHIISHTYIYILHTMSYVVHTYYIKKTHTHIYICTYICTHEKAGDSSLASHGLKLV